MKKLLILFVLLLITCIGHVNGQTCTKIEFTYDDAGNRIQRELVVVSCPGGDRETVSNFPINVYPNPTLDKINISIPADSLFQNYNIQLFDIKGQEVYASIASSLQMQIDVSNLGAGTYILRVTRGGKFATYNIKKS